MAVIHGLEIVADFVQRGGLFRRGILEGGSNRRDFGIVLLENFLDAAAGKQEDRLAYILFGSAYWALIEVTSYEANTKSMLP